MKALTLWQPWATLMAYGFKRIETRSWETKYRGPLAISAAKSFHRITQQLCREEPFRNQIVQVPGYGWNVRKGRATGLPLGKIVAVGWLAACLPIESRPTEHQVPYGVGLVALPPVEPDRSFGDYTPGRYAWIMTDVKRLPTPIPCRGYQQLWDVPAEIQRQIEAQLSNC